MRVDKVNINERNEEKKQKEKSKMAFSRGRNYGDEEWW